MKGVLLAGGTGSRLRPVTAVTNKHLLPVFDRPMIHWPLEVLRANAVRQVIVVTGREHAGAVFALLGSGRDLGFEFTFRVQDEPGGIAEALALAEDFVMDDWLARREGYDAIFGGPFLVVLGDNVFHPEPVARDPLPAGTARVWLKRVVSPQLYGVPFFRKDERDNDRLAGIVEKPLTPPSPYAVTGLYQYDARVFDVIRRLERSARGELEITGVNDAYAREGALDWVDLGDIYWGDCGGSLAGLLQTAVELRDRTPRPA